MALSTGAYVIVVEVLCTSPTAVAFAVPLYIAIVLQLLDAAEVTMKPLEFALKVSVTVLFAVMLNGINSTPFILLFSLLRDRYGYVFVKNSNFVIRITTCAYI